MTSVEGGAASLRSFQNFARGQDRRTSVRKGPARWIRGSRSSRFEKGGAFDQGRGGGGSREGGMGERKT